MDVGNPVLAAVVVWLLYQAVVLAIWKINKVDYLHLADDRPTVVRSIVVPIGAGLVLLAVATTVLGWWDDVMAQPRTGPSWLLVVPALVAVMVVALIAGIDWRHPNARSVLPLLLLGTLFVGAAEELLHRGLLVSAAQQTGWSLWQVYLFSTVLFGLLHAMNVLIGMPAAGGAVQVVTAFLGGTAFFVTLFATGSLVAAVVLHALWDFALIGRTSTERPLKPWEAALVPVVYIVSVVAVVFLLR